MTITSITAGTRTMCRLETHCIQDYQPDMYYYWDEPLVEDYDWRDAAPHVDCMCEICFDILNHEGKIKWKEKNPFELMLDPVND